MLASSPAVAQTTPALPIALELEACPDLDHALVTRLVGIELSAEGDAALQPEDLTRATARCDADGIATVEVDDPTTGKHSTRRVRLDPAGTERLLALAIVELVAASWAEHFVRPRAEVPRVDRTAGREATRRAAEAVAPQMMPVSPPPEEEPPRWLHASLFGSAGVSGRPAHPTLGVGMQVALPAGPRFGALFDASYDVGRVRAEPGDVVLRRVTAAAAVTSRFPLGAWVPYVGVGARAGWAILEGDQDVPGASSVSGRVGGPIVIGGLTYGEGPVMAVGWVELGWYTWSRRGTDGTGEDARVVAAKDRGWGALQIGVAARL